MVDIKAAVDRRVVALFVGLALSVELLEALGVRGVLLVDQLLRAPKVAQDLGESD